VKGLTPPPLQSIEPGGYYEQTADLVISTYAKSGNSYTDDNSHIVLEVRNGSNDVVVQKEFRIGDIGRSEVAFNPSSYDPANPSTDPSLTTVTETVLGTPVVTRRAKGAHGGADVCSGGSCSAACAAAFKQVRIWSGDQDMFIYSTDIDIQKVQNDCGLPVGGVIYASRQDALEDSTMATTGLEDPDRKPYGFRLNNGAELSDPLVFVTNNPLTIKGDFNLHSDADGNGIADVEESSYDPSTDPWKPALIMADRVSFQSSVYDDKIHGIARWADGRKNELDHYASQDACSDPNNRSCHITEGADTEINAAIVAGKSPTSEDYTDYYQNGGSGNFYRSEKSSGSFDRSDPKVSGGFMQWISADESFQQEKSSGSVYNHKTTFRGAFIDLQAAKFSTRYPRTCNAHHSQLLGQGSVNSWGGGNECGAWDQGGTGGGWTYNSLWRQDYKYDPNFNNPDQLPASFRDLFPGGPARVRPFEKKNYKKLEADDSLWQ